MLLVLKRPLVCIRVFLLLDFSIISPALDAILSAENSVHHCMSLIWVPRTYPRPSCGNKPSLISLSYQFAFPEVGCTRPQHLHTQNNNYNNTSFLELCLTKPRIASLLNNSDGQSHWRCAYAIHEKYQHRTCICSTIPITVPHCIYLAEIAAFFKLYQVFKAFKPLLQALQDFMTRPRYVCLGDIIALPVHSTPLLGPVLTAPDAKATPVDTAEDPEKTHSVVFLRVVELTCKPQRDGKTEVCVRMLPTCGGKSCENTCTSYRTTSKNPAFEGVSLKCVCSRITSR